MQRQIRKHNVFKTGAICIICGVILAISAPLTFATGRQYGSPHTSFRFTDAQFERKVKEYLDVPYKPGGASRKGMDCSGFSRTVYSRLFGIELPHSSVDQFRSSALNKIDVKKLQPGDLIFFANKKKLKINHVGVYISDRQFIHASSSQGVTVSSLDDDYWRNRFVGSKRHVALNVAPKRDITRISKRRVALNVALKRDIVRIKSDQKKSYH